MPVKDNDNFWEKTINSLDISPLLETGENSPTLESLPPSKRKVSDGARKVLVQKITTHIYVFTDSEGKVYTSHTAQNLQIFEPMTLEKGLKLAQEDTFS